MWCELFNENEHTPDITHIPTRHPTITSQKKKKKDADCVDNDAVKATVISPPRFAKKLRLDQASLPPTQLPQEIQVLIQ